MSAMRWTTAMPAALLALAAFAIEAPKPASSPATPAQQEPAKPEPEKPEPAQPDAGAGDAEPAPPAGAEPEGEGEAPAATPAPAEDEELPPLPPGTEPAGPPPQRFDPTEKVRADFPVSFPIDI
jgi:hypothetical protein